jgi:predicted RNA binding protein with dsRBD fold (UPF0201 family)
MEITPCIISDHSGIKLDIKNKRKHSKYSNTSRLNTLLKDQQVIAEIRKYIKKFLQSNENENTTFQSMWDTANTMLRGSL